MNHSLCCALAALALAMPAPAQELDLAPLVPPKAPWLKKNQKPAKKPVAKKAKKKPSSPQASQPEPGAPFVAAPPSAPLPLPGASEPAKTTGSVQPAPAAEAVKAPEPAKAPAVEKAPEPAKPPAVATQPAPPTPELPLPPLVPLGPVAAPPLSVSSLALLVQSDDAKSLPAVQEGLQGVVRIAPFTRAAPALPAQACADDACFAALGAANKVDQLLLASYAKGTLQLRLLDVAAKKSIAQAEQAAVPSDLAQAWAEALGCKLLVPAGCFGEATVDLAEGVQVKLDGQPLARGEKRKVAVGVHQLEARAGTGVTQRALPVTREGAPVLYARQVDGQPRLLAKSEMVPVAAIAAAPSAPAPASQRRWKKPVAIAAFGLGAAAAATGIYFGAKSQSDLNSAETAFHANGGAYRAGDLSSLTSGNSAARNANALFVVSGILIAAGAIVSFAF
ncbi:MAG: hypothetical protein ACXWLM_03365 [Myxococcales bacterium]